MHCPHCFQDITPILLLDEDIRQHSTIDMNELDKYNQLTKRPHKPYPFTKTLYDETYETDVTTMFQTHDYYLYYDHSSERRTPRRSLSLNTNVRYQQTKHGLRVLCLKDDKDYLESGLSPRTEMRLGKYSLHLNKAYRITMLMSIPKVNNVGAQFFQIITNEPQKTIFQLEIRRHMFGIRYKHENALLPRPLFPEYANEPIKWEMEFTFTKSEGYVMVYVDGHLLWRGTITIQAKHPIAWIHYGLYKNRTGNPTEDQIIDFHRLKIEELRENV